MSKRQVQSLGLMFALALCLLVTSPTFAQTLSSPNYRFDESTLGQGGLPESESASYKGKSSLGDLAVGYGGSPNYGFQGGSQTTNDPRLAVAVTNSDVDFPTFSPDEGSLATASFEVLNYTSYNYNVFIAGDPPTNLGASHTIPAMADDVETPDAESAPGFEQFGLNLVANSADAPKIPSSIGANPDNGQGQGLTGFAFGQAEADYDNPGKFKYVDGSIIAKSEKSGGFTNYTITFLINVADLTPGGIYNANLALIVVGTY